MYQPAHIDGRTVIILRSAWFGFQVVESGRLTFDGETLSLMGDNFERQFLAKEINSLQPVTAGNTIPQCTDFDFFIVLPTPNK